MQEVGTLLWCMEQTITKSLQNTLLCTKCKNKVILVAYTDQSVSLDLDSFYCAKDRLTPLFESKK